MGQRVMCEICGNKFNPRGLARHQTVAHPDYAKAKADMEAAGADSVGMGLGTTNAEVEPENPKTPAAVCNGDVFRHRSENEWYCVLMTTPDAVFYARTKETSPSLFQTTPHSIMRQKQREMSRSNAEGLVREGKWLHVENIEHYWR